MEPKNQKRRILVVDDDPNFREIFSDLLGPYDLRLASSGSEALEFLESGFEPDVVITDFNMQGMNGAELARSIQQKIRPLIFVCSSDDRARKSVGNLAGTVVVDKSLEDINWIVHKISKYP